MDFNDLNSIRKAGFTGFAKINDLSKDCSVIPDIQGVYMILKDNNKHIEFIEKGTGGHFKGKNPNVSIKELEENWVDNTKVMYIGKATSLNKRVRQYLRFGQGEPVGHWGGRYIWQLKTTKDLIVCWHTLSTVPRETEKELIQNFKNVYGKRPFANLQD